MLDNNPKSDYNKSLISDYFLLLGELRDCMCILFMLKIRNDQYEEKAE